MPTTTQQRPQYAEFDEYIDFQLQRTRKGIRTIDVITAVCGVGVMVLAYLLVFVALDHWVVTGGFSYGWRVFLLSLLLVGTLAWVGWKVVLPYFRSVSRLYAAQTIEGASPELNSNLLNWVDLKQAGREVSPLILRSIEKRAAVTLSHSDLEEVVDRRPLLHWLYALVAVVAVFGLYMALSPKKVGPSIWRALLPASEIQVATLTQIYKVDPPGTEIPARTHLEVTVDLLGDTPSNVSLRYTTADRRFVDQPVELRMVDQDLKRYRCTLTGENNEGLLQDIDFWVIAGDAQSRSYHVTVMQPPSATMQDVTYDFPAYTKLTRETQAGGNVDTLEGTEVTFRATTNMPVKTARLQFSDDEKFSSKGEEQRCTVSEGTRLSSSWKAKFRDDGSFPKFFRIQVETAAGRSDPSPVVQTILLRRDQAPVIELIAPKSDLQVPANAIVPVVMKARDPDFLLRDVALFAEIENQQVFHKLLSEKSEASSEVKFDWKLSELKLKPGDVLTLRIEARDNKEPFANRTVSVKRLLRIAEPVTEKEAQEQLKDDKQKIDQEQRATEGTNKDGDENSPRQEGTESSDKPDPNDPDPKEPKDGKPDEGDKKTGDEKTGDSKADGDQGDGKTSKTGDKSGDKTGDSKTGDDPSGDKKSGDDSKSSGEPKDGSKNGDGKQSAKSNGEDDKDVLEKLIEKQQRDAEKNADQKPQDAKSGDKKSGEPKDGSDPDSSSKPGDAKPGDSKTGNEKKQPSGDPSGKPDPSKPESSKADDKQPMPGDSKPNDSKPGQEPKDKTGSTEKPDPSGKPNSDAKPGSNEKKTDDSKPGDDSKSGKSADEKSPMKDESKTGDSPKKEPTQSDSNDTKNSDTKPSEKPGDADSKNPGNDSKSPSPKKTDDKTADKQPSKSKDPSKDDAAGKSKQPGQPSDKPEDSKPNAAKKPEDKKPGDKDSGASQPSNEKPNSDQSKTAKSDPSQKPDAEKKPGDSKSGDSKPGDSKSGDSKSGDSKPGDSKSGDSKPGDAKPGDEPDPDSKDAAADMKSDKADSEKPGDKDAKSDEPSGDTKQPDGGQKGGEKSKPKSGDAKDGQDQPGKGKAGKGDSSAPGESQGDDQGSGSNKSPAKSGKGAKSLKSGPGNQSDGQEPREKGSGDDSDSTPPQADEPNLEDKLKATNLVLKKLKDELERGEVDDEFLKQLGWTPDDMKRFVDRLDKQMQSQKSDTPAEQARRRQFEEMLKSLDLRSSGTRRDDKNQTKRSTSDFSDKRAPVPLEYKDALERYSKELSKQKKPAK